MKDYWILSLTKDYFFSINNNVYIKIPKNVTYDEIIKLVGKIYYDFRKFNLDKMRERDSRYQDNEITGNIRPIEIYFIFNKLRGYLKEDIIYKNEEDFNDDNNVKSILLRDFNDSEHKFDDVSDSYLIYNRMNKSYNETNEQGVFKFKDFDFTSFFEQIINKRNNFYKKYESFLME